jgi:hypothetical protein
MEALLAMLDGDDCESDVLAIVVGAAFHPFDGANALMLAARPLGPEPCTCCGRWNYHLVDCPRRGR